jgi:hypothetical protein
MSYPRHLYSYLKPESVRVHPEATVRPWATVQVEGDAIGFAAALGYLYVHLTGQFFIPGRKQDPTGDVRISTNVATASAKVP